MPRVPEYNGPHVQTAPAPGPRVSVPALPDAFGVGSGEALRDVGRAAASIVSSELKEANEDQVLEMENRILDFRNKRLPEALNARGKDALGASEALMSEYDQMVGEIESSGLHNDAQRRLFNRVRTAHRISLGRALESHVAGQIAETRVNERRASIANWRQFAADNYNSPEDLATAFARTEEDIDAVAGVMGMGAEQKKALRREVLSSTHQTVIRRMLSQGEDRKAAEYLKANRPDMLAEHAERLEADIAEESVEREAVRVADSITSAMPDLSSRGAALAEARKIGDVGVRDRVVARVNQFYNERQVSDREATEQIFNNAAALLESNGGDLMAPAVREVWQSLTPAQRSGLRSVADEVGGVAKIETDWGLYYDLQTLASSDATRERFVGMDLTELRGRLGTTEFKELTKLQADLRSSSARRGAEDLLAGVRTKYQVVNDALDAVKIKPDSARGVAFKRAVDQEVLALQRATGREATSDDVQKIADRLMIVADPDTWFDWQKGGKDLRAFEVTIDDVPEEDQRKIAEALGRRGVRATPEEIVRLYRLKLEHQNAGQ